MLMWLKAATLQVRSSKKSKFWPTSRKIEVRFLVELAINSTMGDGLDSLT